MKTPWEEELSSRTEAAAERINELGINYKRMFTKSPHRKWKIWRASKTGYEYKE